MCDYSLKEYRSKKAAKGDDLQLHKFGSGSKGFIMAGGDDTCAVCVSEDTLMTLTDPHGKERTALFAQRDVTGNSHRDGVIFEDDPNTFVLLQGVPLGTRAKIVALPGEVVVDASIVAAATQKAADRELVTVR
jgi:hypothetical protein